MSREHINEQFNPGNSKPWSSRDGILERKTSFVTIRSKVAGILTPLVQKQTKTDKKTKTAVNKAVTAMAFATLILAMFHSNAFRIYVRDLPGNAVSDRLVQVADNWHHLMKTVGFAGVTTTVREAVADLHDATHNI